MINKEIAYKIKFAHANMEKCDSFDNYIDSVTEPEQAGLSDLAKGLREIRTGDKEEKSCDTCSTSSVGFTCNTCKSTDKKNWTPKEEKQTCKNTISIDCHYCEDPCLKDNPKTIYPCGCDINAVHWNEFNNVVQCHVCGHVYEPKVYDKPKKIEPLIIGNEARYFDIVDALIKRSDELANAINKTNKVE